LVAEPLFFAFFEPNCEEITVASSSIISEYCKLMHTGISEVFWKQLAMIGYAALAVGFFAASLFFSFEKHLKNRK
jgi:hypothetical protein